MTAEPGGSAEPDGSRGPFGLHRTVLLLAATHFIVDGYGNILAPLLPLLITNLGLSLFAAGTLQMCFQLANSVSQLAFGHIADRWRPRVLLLAGPILCVIVLPLIGLAPNPVILALVLILGGLGGAAFLHLGSQRRGFLERDRSRLHRVRDRRRRIVNGIA